MALYRFHFYDWTTQTLLDTLSVEQASMTWEASSAGTFTGIMDLRDPSLPAARVIPATEPLRTKLFVERDATLIWGGQLTEPRSYDSSTGKLTINGQETIGYFSSRYVPTLKLYGYDQMTIAQTILTQLQADPGGNAHLQIAFPTGLSGILRDGVYSQYDFTSGLQALTDLAGMTDGFEFGTDVQWVGGAPSETLVIAYPRLGRIGAASPAVIEYNEWTSGNCVSYTWPDGPGLFTRTWTDATTPDGVQLDAHCDNLDLIDAGYPMFEQKIDVTSSKPTTLAILQAYANKYGGWADGERVAAVFNVRPTSGMEIGDWQMGDDVMVRISDYRFPPGPQGQPGFADYMRISQVQCTTDSNGLEQYQLTTHDWTEPV